MFKRNLLLRAGGEPHFVFFVCLSAYEAIDKSTLSLTNAKWTRGRNRLSDDWEAFFHKVLVVKSEDHAMHIELYTYS